MIIVFPMLTDEGISQNILPGICKALEKFILIYEMDTIMKITGWSVIGAGAKIAHQTMIGKQKKESYNILEAGGQFAGTKPGYGPKKIEDDEDEDEKDNSHKNQSYGGPGKPVFDTLKGLRDMGTVKVDIPKDQSLSVEPTYVSIQTSIGTQILGIKVIPCSVKSNKYTLAELLTADVSLKFFDALIYRISRKAIRGFWSLCRALRLPFIKDKVITGDPEKDILWAQSYHKKNIFCLLNYADFSNSELFKEAGGIYKLHSLGWNSFIVADEVNKRATFCMKEFHGLCSTIPYSYIMASFGKDINNVYIDSVEAFEKTNSPFFKTKISQKRLIGESKDILGNYLRNIK
jgi:hypothetical protein